MSKLGQLRAMREARFNAPAQRGFINRPQPVTRVPVVSIVPGCVTTVTGHCPACGQRLPAQNKAAAKQRAYRQRKKG